MSTYVRIRRIGFLRLDNGDSPFEEWLGRLDSSLARAVDARLVRIRDGNFGNHKGVGRGVFELIISKGPGLRVYYGLEGDDLVVLIGGGDKSTQDKDIKRFQELWRSYKNESRRL